MSCPIIKIAGISVFQIFTATITDDFFVEAVNINVSLFVLRKPSFSMKSNRQLRKVTGTVNFRHTMT